MNADDMIRRLARSQARGPRQSSFINELLSFKPVRYRLFRIPDHPHLESALYGDSELARSSYRNLHKRMVNVGFTFKTDNNRQTVELSFPEGKK